MAFVSYFLSKLPVNERKITISTLLTILRIILTPIVVGTMILQWWGFAFIFFFIAAITDMLDGNIARWRNEQTFLGALLDPIADKLLTLSCFFTLAFVQSSLFSIPKWFFIIILIKELLLISGVFLFSMYRHKMEIHPLILGKITTFVQMVFIIWIFACYFFKWQPIKTYYTMLALVFILVIATLLQYSFMGIAWVLTRSVQ